MRVIYEPRGRAREYAALACNLYTFWKVGKLNYDKAVEARTDWTTFLVQVRSQLNSLGAKYYIKRDLLKYANETQ